MLVIVSEAGGSGARRAVAGAPAPAVVVVVAGVVSGFVVAGVVVAGVVVAGVVVGVVPVPAKLFQSIEYRVESLGLGHTLQLPEIKRGFEPLREAGPL